MGQLPQTPQSPGQIHLFNAVVPGPTLPTNLLSLVTDIAFKIDTPFLFVHPYPVLERIPWNHKFRKPTLIVDRGPDIPYPVPKGIGRGPVVENLQIRPGPHRIGHQHNPVATIAVRIQHHHKIIIQGIIKISAHFPRDQGLRVLVVTPNRHVEMLFIVGHSHLGPLGRRQAHLQFALGKLGDPGNMLPTGIIQTTIHTGRNRHPHRPVLVALPRYGQCKQNQGQKRHQERRIKVPKLHPKKRLRQYV